MRAMARTARRRLAALLGVGAGLLASAPSALAIEAPAVGDHPPAGPINANQGAFGWGAVEPDAGNNILRYEGGAVTNPDASPATAFNLNTSATVALPEGTVYFKVRAVQIAVEGGQVTEGPYATFPATLVDRTAPAISPSLAGSGGTNGWFRSAVSVRWTCADNVAVASCPPHEVVTGDGVHALPRVATDTAGNSTSGDAVVKIDATKPSLSVLLVGTPNAAGWYRSLTIDWMASDATSGIARVTPDGVPPQGANRRLLGTAIDKAGNVATTETPPFSLDSTPPTAPPAQAPASGSAVARPPVIRWGASADTLSGVDHYDLHLQVPGSADRVRTAGANVTQLDLAPLNLGLPEGTPITWFAVAVDRAGNAATGSSQSFTILRPPTPAPRLSRLALPSRNAGRLRPRRGATLLTLRPTLRWMKGSRGTTLYNVQVFKVVRPTNGAPRLVKVISVFPRGAAYRTPKGRLAPDACYVWRVWPYMTRRFTPRALGVSHFCVGSRERLAQHATRLAASQAAV